MTEKLKNLIIDIIFVLIFISLLIITSLLFRFRMSWSQIRKK